MMEYWLFALFLVALFSLGLLEYWLGLTNRPIGVGLLGPGAYLYLIWLIIGLTIGLTAMTFLFFVSQFFTAYLFFSFFQAGKKAHGKQLAETQQLEDEKLR
ncbi:MAG: hypothetical protein ABF483_00910 [Liquorilactobacillus nagelii]|jgi:hypothetical protein|uniref:Uncharacterized protein n=2 Tax=Liquorilactobacillus nagelii TaxID=82688 RepID=A0A3S6QUQ9_9LACO|nr:hypothetical protein [Liquorilactobacillus nagelii]AUJ31793.1 hypothetical protein BSQ50_03985 [Liquorilactobacillus nagelii]MCC7615832.1 hypothetical protein [Liquorilactobacillus nagelii]MCI1632929.1 hypothetical protein [Liquorilactobacillus nagelii]MCP9314138.1 hypothetical protein [Liquorilactobacillus nagelii]